jgi:hypothetical protein
VVSNTYCVVFLLIVFSSCVPYVAGFSGLSIFDCFFGKIERLLREYFYYLNEIAHFLLVNKLMISLYK